MKRTTVKDKVQVNAMKEPGALSKEQERMRRRHGVVVKSSPVLSYDPAQQVEHEQHFTPAQIAKQWGISVHTVRRLFADIPGVLKIGQKGSCLFFAFQVGSYVHIMRSSLPAAVKSVMSRLAVASKLKQESISNGNREPSAVYWICTVKLELLHLLHL